MGNAFNKEVARSITQSAGRFIAIVIISLLGAGFYAGLRMSAPDMRLAGDEFFDGANLYDVSVMTTLGLDDESVDMLRGVDGVGAVMPTYRVDAMVQVSGSSYAASVESFPVEAAAASSSPDGVRVESDDEGYLNRLLLLEGSWPAEGARDECVVGADAAAKLGISIGDTITLEKAAASDGLDVGGFGLLAGNNDEIDDTFRCTELTVVGFVNSAAFASSSSLGPTSIGTGSIELYLYVPRSMFAADLPYSVAYLDVPAADGEIWGSDAYDAAVAHVVHGVEEISDELASARLDAVEDELHHEFTGVLYDMSKKLDWAEGLEKPEVFVLDRSKNPGVASLDSDAEGIAQIATYIPFAFFLVAALVSLTSMTRMVDEERQVIGTHKALGYGKGRITSKYLIYGALASGVGSIVGIFLLGKLLPWFILTSYQVSYAIPTAPIPIDVAIAARAFGLSVGVTLLATWWAASSTLRSKPAELMLPRVPKAGKRIVLEHIGPLWRRMSFSQKVTARNLLRYKRRFFMAVVGVAGCTALLMIGFGLRDAIGGIVSNQYEVLMNYDAAVRVDDDAPKSQREDALHALDAGDAEDYLVVSDFNMVAKGADENMRIEVVVPSDPARLSEFVQLRDRASKEPIDPLAWDVVSGLDDGASPDASADSAKGSSGDNADGAAKNASNESAGASPIVLTEKAARVLGVSKGDTVELFDENAVGDPTGDGRAFTVAGIAENYLGHYAYLSPQGYRNAFEEAPVFDLAYVKLADDADTAAFSKRMLGTQAVDTVSFVADKIVTYQDMLDVMNKLIYVVVLLSAALAFVVLYNLTNINIAERVREIATLKVLGFTRGEVNTYIFREVIIMALIGALVGCLLGVPSTFYIAEATETANMMFGRSIEPVSFLFSFALTVAFAVLVAFAMRGKLVRVNMVESLKSVE